MFVQTPLVAANARLPISRSIVITKFPTLTDIFRAFAECFAEEKPFNFARHSLEQIKWPLKPFLEKIKRVGNFAAY